MTPISLTRLLMKRFILHPDFEKAGILNLLRSSIQLQAPNFEDQEKRSRIKKMFVLSKSFNDNHDFYKQTFGICDIFVNSYSFLYLHCDIFSQCERLRCIYNSVCVFIRNVRSRHCTYHSRN